MAEVMSCPVGSATAPEPAAAARAALNGPSDEAFGHYTWLREHAPVFADARSGTYVISGYEQCRFVLQNPDIFRSPRDGELARRNRAGKGARTGSVLGGMITTDILNTGGATHRRLRAALAPAFSPPRLKLMRPAIEATVAGLVGDALGRLAADDEVDFREAFSLPLPLAVVGELIGIPPADRQMLRAISVAIAPPGPGVPGQGEAGARKLAELTAYLDDLIEQRRREPRDDLISALVARTGHDDDQRLTLDEARTMCYVMQLAGYDTTVAGIDNLAVTLLTHPELGDQLTDDRSAMKFIDEVLRWAGVAKTANGVRYATRDTELCGVRIPAGSEVSMIIGTAHRDPQAFERPSELDFTRRGTPALTFGTGIHFCAGAPLARMEMMLLFREVQERLPGLTLAGPPVPSANRTLVTYASIPTRLRRDPGAAGEGPAGEGSTA